MEMTSNQEFNEIDFLSLEQRIFQSLEELISKREAVDTCRKDLVSRTQAYYELEQTLERERRETEVSRSQLSFTSERVNEWQAERATAASREARLQAELEACSSERQTLLNRTNQDQAKLDQMSRTIEEQQLRIRTLTSFEKSTRAGEAKLRTSIACLQTQIKKLETELARLEGHTKSAAKLGLQMNILKIVSEKEANDLKERAEEAESRVSSLEAQLKIGKYNLTNEELQKENPYFEEWDQSRAIMIQRLNHSEENYASLSVALDQAFQTQAQLQCLVSGLQNQLAQSEKEVTRLQDEIEQINTSFKMKNNEEKIDKDCQTENI